MESNSSRSSETGLLSRTTGIRATRKCFSLVSKTIASSPDDEEPQEDPLLDLEIFLRQTWNIWGVSALFNFQVDDEVQLKQYAKKLREEVACMLTQEDVSYEAKVSALDIQRPKETDHPVVKIEVYAQVRDKEKETSVYQGYLLSWRSEPLDQGIEHATQLPLLLCRGTANTMRAVHATLGRMFDCMLLQLPAIPEDLAWLLPIFLSPGGGQDTARDNDELRLEYTVPGLPKTETISIKFMIKNLIDLWNTYLEGKNTIEADEVAKFHEILQNQILEISSIQLGLCTLYKIQLPSITIAESKMKVINVEAMNTVLTYLNEKALDALHMNPTQLSISK